MMGFRYVLMTSLVVACGSHPILIACLEWDTKTTGKKTREFVPSLLHFQSHQHNESLNFAGYLVKMLASGTARMHCSERPSLWLSQVFDTLRRTMSQSHLYRLNGWMGGQIFHPRYDMMRGYKVGIFDCDVYGPSLPVMVRFQEETPRFSASRVRHHVFVDVSSGQRHWLIPSGNLT